MSQRFLLDYVQSNVQKKGLSNFGTKKEKMLQWMHRTDPPWLQKVLARSLYVFL